MATRKEGGSPSPPLPPQRLVSSKFYPELFRIAFTESYDLLLTAMVKTLIFAPCVVKVLPPRVSEKHLFYYLPRLG